MNSFHTIFSIYFGHFGCYLTGQFVHHGVSGLTFKVGEGLSSSRATVYLEEAAWWDGNKRLSPPWPGALRSSVSEGRGCILSRWRAHTPGSQSRPGSRSYCGPTRWYSSVSSRSCSPPPSWCASPPSCSRCTSSPGTRQGRPSRCAVVCSTSPADTRGMPSPCSASQSPPYKPSPSSPHRTWRTLSHSCSWNRETFNQNLRLKPFSLGFFKLQRTEDWDVNTEVFQSVVVQNLWPWVLRRDVLILRNTEVQPLWKS